MHAGFSLRAFPRIAGFTFVPTTPHTRTKGGSNDKKWPAPFQKREGPFTTTLQEGPNLHGMSALVRIGPTMEGKRD